MKQYSLVILKPDCLVDNKHLGVLEELTTTNLKIIKIRFVKLEPKQVRVIYREKLNCNYYPLLEKFMTSAFSLCILVYGENAIKESQMFKDKIRKRFGRMIKLSKRDLILLKKGIHPRQREITVNNALENLIHVPDNSQEVVKSIDSIF